MPIITHFIYLAFSVYAFIFHVKCDVHAATNLSFTGFEWNEYPRLETRLVQKKFKVEQIFFFCFTLEKQVTFSFLSIQTYTHYYGRNVRWTIHNSAVWTECIRLVKKTKESRKCFEFKREEKTIQNDRFIANELICMWIWFWVGKWEFVHLWLRLWQMEQMTRLLKCGIF